MVVLSFLLAKLLTGGHMRTHKVNINEYSKSVGGISFHASKDLSESLSVDQVYFDRVLLDMISFCLLLTYQGIKESNLPDHMYKEVLQGIARNIAQIIADSGETEQEYQIIMAAFQEYSQNYATSDSQVLIEKSATGFIEKYQPSKQEDFFAYTQTSMVLGNVAQSLSAKTFAGSLK